MPVNSAPALQNNSIIQSQSQTITAPPPQQQPPPQSQQISGSNSVRLAQQTAPTNPQQSQNTQNQQSQEQNYFINTTDPQISDSSLGSTMGEYH